MSLPLRRTLPLLTALCLTSGSAAAWETAVQESAPWMSIFVTVGQGFDHPNEHALIAHDALKALGQHLNVGLSATPLATFRFVDVSSATLHPEVLGDSYDANAATAIEERAAASPAQFAGLPDFAYGIYDWITKNQTALCPGVPAGVSTRGLCYDFKGWLGAGFNASHFGTQAREMYLHLHAIALELADRAAAARVLLDPATRPIEAALYDDFVAEAQLEALYYEGYAQHYLQDRWSTGHMWERWSGADYASVPKIGGDLTTFGHSFAVGAMSGLVHGSEAIRRSWGLEFLTDGVLDPMCSPEITPTMRPWFYCPDRSEVFAQPMRFRTAAGEDLGGVGDFRYLDMLEGRVDASCVPVTNPVLAEDYPGLIILVSEQRDRMAACGQQGWGEVLTALADPKLAPSALPGVDLGLDASFSGRDELACWGNWMTNEAMYKGWVQDDLVKIGDAVRTKLVTKSPLALPLTEAFRWAMGNVGAKMTSRFLAAPSGTDLARGATLPRMFAALPGNTYVSAADRVPDWAMPLGFSDPTAGVLPWIDPARGRDQHTMFGFFNRAHADFWCANPERIAAWRGSAGHSVDSDADKARLDACTWLADRFYRGSDARYEGLRAERRAVSSDQNSALGLPLDAEYAPMCALFGVTTTSDPETLPVEVHAGYVGAAGALGDLGYDTIEAWCHKAPVLDYLWMPSAAVRDSHHWRQWRDDHRWDVAAVADRDGGPLTLPGLHLDAAGGTLTLHHRGCRHGEEDGEGCQVEGEQVGVALPVSVPYTASGTSVSFELPKDLAVGDFMMELTPTAGPTPAGLFLLRVIAESVSAPQVLDVYWDNVKPGENAVLEALVYDPDGWIDLNAAPPGGVAGAFVDVTSDVLQAGTVTLDTSIADTPTTAFFSTAGGVAIKTLLNDKLASCPPPEYEVKSRATDTGLSVNMVTPEPRTGPLHKSDVTVLNCAPTSGTNDFSQAVKAKPGGTLNFTVAFSDDNHDGQPGCDELPAANVAFKSHPSGLMTGSTLPSLAWSSAGSAPPERTFETSVGVDPVHRDNVFSATVETSDDRDPVKATAGPVGIEIENVPPAVVSVAVEPPAVHPDTPTTIVVTVVATDDNTWQDIEDDPGMVLVDLTLLGAGIDEAMNTGGTKARWTGTRSATVTAPGQIDAVPIPVSAIDDDLATGAGVGALLVKNVPPDLSGAGFVWDASGEVDDAEGRVVRACQQVDVAAIASDKNRDQLRVDVRFAGVGAPMTAQLEHQSGNVYHATIPAPCPGTYTLTYTAVEIHPDGSGRVALASAEKTLTMTVLPAEDPCTCKTCICSGQPADASCDDCEACTEASTCQAGVCVGPPKTCAQDDNPCTLARCDPNDGECASRSVDDGATCSSGDVCKTAEICTGGVCGGGTVISGCCHQDIDCADGNVCTDDDCDVATGVCSNPAVAGTPPCDDGDACTQQDACFMGVCGGIAVTCPSSGNPCANDECDDADGECKAIPANEGESCDDSDPCTANTTCVQGSCTGGAPVSGCCDDAGDCVDGNPCTADECGDDGMCAHQAAGDGGACPPPGLCTGFDVGTCHAGACALAFPLIQVPPGGAVYPQNLGQPANTLPDWLDFASAEVRFALSSDPITETPCSRVGVAFEMRAPLPAAGDSPFIDITIIWFHPDFTGDPGQFGPPSVGATHMLSVGWNPGNQQWTGHLWQYVGGGGPTGGYSLIDANVPFVIEGDRVVIERPIDGFDGCVPHKLLTRYQDSNGDSVWKMATAGEAGVSLDPNQPPIPCP